jgi:hypothetical protein
MQVDRPSLLDEGDNADTWQVPNSQRACDHIIKLYIINLYMNLISISLCQMQGNDSVGHRFPAVAPTRTEGDGPSSSATVAMLKSIKTSYHWLVPNASCTCPTASTASKVNEHEHTYSSTFSAVRARKKSM